MVHLVVVPPFVWRLLLMLVTLWVGGVVALFIAAKRELAPPAEPDRFTWWAIEE